MRSHFIWKYGVIHYCVPDTRWFCRVRPQNAQAISSADPLLLEAGERWFSKNLAMCTSTPAHALIFQGAPQPNFYSASVRLKTAYLNLLIRPAVRGVYITILWCWCWLPAFFSPLQENLIEGLQPSILPELISFPYAFQSSCARPSLRHCLLH